ncbi:MAG: WHG domain-containing protein [Deltaproteobacteria bacterium]|nr:WHG domain-containing protein [Deltaproteobacteria bacterium]
MPESAIDEAPVQVCDALLDGTLGAPDLTARRLGAHLGKTTSVLYHQWGSLDGFLYAVSRAAMSRLGEHVLGGLANGPELAAIAEAFVTFGIEQPVLYGLMFERRYDWDALRAAGVFDERAGSVDLWQALVAFFEAGGSQQADTDARVLFAALHGLVSLAHSGRANVGVLSVSDLEAAIAAARSIADRMAPPHTETEK